MTGMEYNRNSRVCQRHEAIEEIRPCSLVVAMGEDGWIRRKKEI